MSLIHCVRSGEDQAHFYPLKDQCEGFSDLSNGELADCKHFALPSPSKHVEETMVVANLVKNVAWCVLSGLL